MSYITHSPYATITTPRCFTDLRTYLSEQVIAKVRCSWNIVCVVSSVQPVWPTAGNRSVYACYVRQHGATPSLCMASIHDTVFARPPICSAPMSGTRCLLEGFAVSVSIQWDCNSVTSICAFVLCRVDYCNWPAHHQKVSVIYFNTAARLVTSTLVLCSV